MTGTLIRLVLTNLPVLLFAAAFVVAGLLKQPTHFPTRLLNWLLLLSVGGEEVWAGLFHVFFPEVAAASIGWQVSPFQFEIGVADLAIGVTAVIAFWRSIDFKAAVIVYVVLFYIGVAIGHVHQAISTGDMSANNFGPLLLITVLKVFLLPGLYVLVRRSFTLARQGNAPC
jgi:hypothetical protein